MATNIYKLTAEMYGETVDLTDDIIEIAFRFGEIQPNQAGTLLRPMDGFIRLYNNSGIYNPYSPGSKNGKKINPLPQVEYSLFVNDKLIMRAKTEGMKADAISTGHRTVTLPMMGAINSAGVWGQGLRLDVKQVLPSGQIAQYIFDEMGIPQSRQVVDAGHSRIRGLRLNPQLKGGRKTLKRATDSLKALSRAECGRIYDDAIGKVYFEDRDHRSVFNYGDARYGFKVINGNKSSIVGHPQNAATRPLHELILNSATSSVTQYSSAGEQKLRLVDNIGNDIPYPIRIEVPPLIDLQEARTTEFYVDPSGTSPITAFLQSATRPRGYTPIDALFDFDFDEIKVYITAYNIDTEPYTLVIPAIYGEPWVNTGNNNDIHVRNQKSIAAFGPRPFVVESDLLDDFDEINDYIHNLINRHDGMDNDNVNINTIRSINVTLNLSNGDNEEFMNTQISHLIEVRLPQLGIEKENFFVDSVEHKITEKGEHTIKLGMSDARWTQTWNIDSMILGQDTILGY